MRSDSQILLVCNRYSSIDQINIWLNKYASENVLLLTSHGLFDLERSALEHPNLEVLNFTDLTDQELASKADKKAFEQNKDLIPMYSVYVRKYKEDSIFYKNQLIYGKLDRTYKKIHVFCGDRDLHNLNISKRFWRTTGATFHTPDQMPPDDPMGIRIKKLTGNRSVAKLIYRIKAFINFNRKRKFIVVSDVNEEWYFPTLKRVAIRENVEVKEVDIKPKNIPSNARLVVPLHSSHQLLNLHPFLDRKNVIILQDAFRPSVYPPYLFAYAFSGCEFIPRDEFDRRLFKKVGDITEVDAPAFIRFTKPFAPPETGEEIKTLILSLNHAGDWTAEISRSDTDILIQKWMDMAARDHNRNWIIRLHPTMDSPDGEGANAMARIREVVEQSAIPSLSVSDVSLEEDWERGDMFVSEYSLSAIDALAKGKPVLFVNLTNRQSYMTDYVKLGFEEASDEESFERILATILADPKSHFERQTKAYREYLHKFSRFESELH